MRKDDWEVIYTLYQHPNLTKAASLLFISQPALTKRLQQIEEEFGVVIADRTSKGVMFTPQGEYLAQQAQRFIQLMQETRYHLVRMENGESGHLKIGAPSSAARFLLPRVLRQYNDLYPNVTLHLQVLLSGLILPSLQQGEIHIGFMNGDRPHHEYQLLYSTGCGYVVSTKPLALEELPSIPMIRHSRDLYSRTIIDEWWQEHFKQPPRIGMEVSDIDTCLRMIQSGLGYGIVYDNYLIEADPSQKLYQLPMLRADGSAVCRNTWLVCREDYEEVPLIRNFIQFFRETVAAV